MATLRTVTVPLDHLVAELAAFPLATESAIRSPVAALSPSLAGRTGRLWRDAESKLLARVPGFSLDELLALRDAVWFGSDRIDPAVDACRFTHPHEIAPEPLHRYVQRLARGALVVRGSVAYPCLTTLQNSFDGDNADAVAARQHYRWLTFALPPDVLLAGLEAPATHVELLSPALAQILHDEGYVESHLHLGAALDFEALWCGTLRSLASRPVHEDFFADAGADFDAGSTLCAWLLRAAIARYLLATFLVGRNPGEDFARYLLRIRSALLREHGASLVVPMHYALRDLRNGVLGHDAPLPVLREAYAELARIRGDPTPQTFEEWKRADPVHRCLRAGSELGEASFLRHGFAYLDRVSAVEGYGFAELFWQAVRIRGGLYRHVVQRPMTPGLQWFVRFYGRMARARGQLPDGLKLQLAARTCGAGLGLQSLEVRTAPDLHPAQVLAQVRDLARAAAAIRDHQPDLEIGVVYHFCKERGGRSALWAGTHADPTAGGDGRSGANRSGVRYGTFFSEQRQRAIALVWVLHHFPDAVRLLRGVDVCTDELAVPNWVLAPLLRYVRTAASDALSVASARRGERFATTVHAGEDFVHLLTGLRNLDEALDDYALQEGDRIGHGLALGIEPTEWARRAGRLAVLVEDRLMDLVWVWGHLSPEAGAGLEAGRLEREVRYLSEAMFGAEYAPHDLQRLRRQLRSETALRRAGFPSASTARPDCPLPEYLTKYLTDPVTFRRGRRTVWIDAARDCDLVVLMQKRVRAKVARRGIMIEVNPSSNLLIGDFGDLTSHPLWRLRPPRRDGPTPELSVCVGSDDPAVFASNIREEYQWLEDAMRLAGASDEEARRWLERTRACGLEGRFTVATPLAAGRLIGWRPLPFGDMPTPPL